MLSAIQNRFLTLTVESRGAEIQSLLHKPTQTELIWQGDPAYWDSRSPLLFPVIAKQKENSYRWEGQTYPMPMHGFAHLMDFTLRSFGADRLHYQLLSNEETLPMYPFAFSLEVVFSLTDETLQVAYAVENRSAATMPYSIGGHTGYRVPLKEGEACEDYSLFFQYPETAPRYPLENKLLGAPMPYLDNQDEIPLSQKTFDRGALIFQGLRSRQVSLRNRHSGQGVRVAFGDFDCLGLWAAPRASFVCIEPWNGLPSKAEDDAELLTKAGLRFLLPQQRHHFTHTLEILPGKGQDEP